MTIPGPEWIELGLEAALRSALLVLMALAAAALARRASADARHRIWVVALGGVLVLPALMHVLPDWKVLPVPHLHWTAAETIQPPPGSERMALPGWVEVTAGDPLTASAGPVAAAERGKGAWARPDGRRFAGVLWILGTLVLLARLAFSLRRMRTLSRGGRELTDRRWGQHACSLADRLGVRRHVRLLRHPAVIVPMTWGVSRPVILLPPGADDWDEERRRVVLAHELAHIARWDAVTQWVGHLAVALFWFNPLVWLAARRLRQEREQACDAAVLALGARPSVYAHQLLSLASELGSGRGPAAALAMARRSQLEERLLAILEPSARPRGVARIGATGLCALLVLALMPLASLGTSPETDGGAAAGPTEPFMIRMGAETSEISVYPDGREVEVTWSPATGGAGTPHGAAWFEFHEDWPQVVRLSPGARLTIQERDDDRVRQAAFTGQSGGAVALEYHVNTQRLEPDERALAWARARLTEETRVSGLGAAPRTADLYSRLGVSGLLPEIERLEGDGARGRYYRALLAQPSITEQEVMQLVEHARRTLPDERALRDVLAALPASAGHGARPASEGLTDSQSRAAATQLVLPPLPAGERERGAVTGSHSNTTRRISTDGQVTYTDAGDWVAAISEGGSLTVEEIDDDAARRAIFLPDAGAGVRVEFAVDGQPLAANEKLHAWVRGLLLEKVRRGGR
jgi:hypothetical protein